MISAHPANDAEIFLLSELWQNMTCHQSKPQLEQAEHLENLKIQPDTAAAGILSSFQYRLDQSSF